MRHLKAGRKLNRSGSHRSALMRNLVTALLRHEKIRTTDAKAKEIRRWADWMIGLGKEGSLHARRRALGFIQDKDVVRKLFDALAQRFKERAGGYSRIVKIGWRLGDRAPLSLIELVEEAKAGGGQAGGKKKAPRPARKRGKGGAEKKARASRGAEKP